MRAGATILCFGDSNTHGTMPMASLADQRRHARDVRWTGHLRAGLSGDVQVIEEGQPGRTTTHDDPVEGPHKNGLTVLPSILESHRPIDLVVLMLGTNDLKARFAVTPADIARSLGRLCMAVRISAAGPDKAPPALLVVCPPPIVEVGLLGDFFLGGAAKSHLLSRHAAVIAAEQGAGFLDAGALIASSPVDGIHFDAAAHHVLGQAIAARVVEGLGPGDSSG